MVDEAGVVKISDFGLSRRVDGGPEAAGATQSNIGPIRWMAPENFHRVYSSKSDVWFVIFRLLHLAFFCSRRCVFAQELCLHYCGASHWKSTAYGARPPQLCFKNQVRMCFVVQGSGSALTEVPCGRDQGLAPEVPPGTDPVLSDILRRCWSVDPAERPTFAQIAAVLRGS